jgi:hypothetical protein
MGVRPKDATVVSGVGGDGPSAILVSVYLVPGADRAALEGAFTDLDGPPNATWMPRTIEGQRVMWRAAHGLAAAFWAQDGAVYHIGASEPGFESLVTKLLLHSIAVSGT